MKEYLQSVSFKEIKATQQPREDDASVAQGLGEVKALAHSQGQGEETGARGERVQPLPKHALRVRREGVGEGGEGELSLYDLSPCFRLA